MAGWRETQALKPIGKPIMRVGSEPSGRNESERETDLENTEPQRPSPQRRGEGSMERRSLAEAASHSGGVEATARWQGRVEQLEKPSSSRRESGGARYAL
jgi:hypothetical protein